MIPDFVIKKLSDSELLHLYSLMRSELRQHNQCYKSAVDVCKAEMLFHQDVCVVMEIHLHYVALEARRRKLNADIWDDIIADLD